MKTDPTTSKLCALAEQALLDRLAMISIDHYLDGLRSFRRYARIATHSSPALDADMPLAQTRKAIRIAKAAGLQNSGKIIETMSGSGALAIELRELLLPLEVVVGLAEALRLGRAEEARRLKAFADAMAAENYAPGTGREAQLGYAPASLQHRVTSVKCLLDCFVEHAANNFDGDVKALRGWRKEVAAPTITPHPDAGEKELLTPPIESLVEQMAFLDEQIAERFVRVTGVTDLELSEERWRQAFHDDAARQKWIRRTGLLRLTLDRALVAVGAETTLRSLGLHEMRWAGFSPNYTHSALAAEKGADQPGGVVFAIGMKGQKARFKPISPQTTRRVVVYRWIVEALIAPKTLDDYPRLSMWNKIGSDGVPGSLGERWINDRFRTKRASQPNSKHPYRSVLCPMDPAAVRDETAPRIGAGHHGLRRAGDQIIFHYFERWKAGNPNIPPGLEGVHVKEACLDHENIPGDVLGYTGLRGEAARVVLAYYGSRTIAAALYDGLTLPRGRDEMSIRKVVLDMHAVDEMELNLELAFHQDNRRLVELDDSSTDLLYLQQALREAKLIGGQKNDRAQQRRSQLGLVRGELERRLKLLVDNEEWWTVLAAGAKPLSVSDVERLRSSILASSDDRLTPPQVRNLLLQREVAEIFRISTETLRRQRRNDPRCDRNRFYPRDSEPVFDLDQREPLYHPGAWYPECLTGDIAARIQQKLAEWPVDPAWQPGGAKRRKLERLSPIVLDARRLNPLGADETANSYLRLA